MESLQLVMFARYRICPKILQHSIPMQFFFKVLCQIEGILKSRPLSPQSSDPNDLLPLTPGHFLIGKPVTSLPEPNLLNEKENYLSKYQRLQQLVQHFWQRWQREYIPELQLRLKWRQESSNLVQVNDLVIIKEDHLCPGQWRLGRVMQLHPEDDGVTRVVTIKCSGGVLKRSLSKVCKLPNYD
ncbi:hypothetical protein NQ317_002691 [Molorchus minor]|uniref:DUF5641 domain-containing protein n=1 Tax=Molorchus minor TaxID=1323400 RepID=A0ABQ9JX45_9CUCU|nr:hypothetical protein NQ317_002691 [Molorchus minor]